MSMTEENNDVTMTTKVEIESPQKDNNPSEGVDNKSSEGVDNKPYEGVDGGKAEDNDNLQKQNYEQLKSDETTISQDQINDKKISVSDNSSAHDDNNMNILEPVENSLGEETNNDKDKCVLNNDVQDSKNENEIEINKETNEETIDHKIETTNEIDQNNTNEGMKSDDVTNRMSPEPSEKVDDEIDQLLNEPDHERKDSFADILIDQRLNFTPDKKENITLEAELAQFTEDLHLKNDAPSPMMLSSDDDDDDIVANDNKIDKEAATYESEFLTRRIMEGRENESYLKSKLAEKERDLDTSQNKIKDLQLRLIRFTKDDQAKDKRVAMLEKEIRETNKKIEEMLTDHELLASKQQQENVIAHDTSSSATQSKSCVIL